MPLERTLEELEAQAAVIYPGGSYEMLGIESGGPFPTDEQLSRVHRELDSLLSKEEPIPYELVGWGTDDRP
jgi:hypothetical protein